MLSQKEVKLSRERRISTINDFLQFADADLEAPLPPDAYYVISRVLSLSPPLNDSLSDSWLYIVRENQAEWRTKLNWLVDHLDKGLLLYLTAPVNFSWGPREDDPFIYGPPYGLSFQYHFEALVFEQPVAAGSEPIERVQMPFYVIMLFEALHVFPKTALLRCPHCQRVFFNPTRRKKKYCSLRCQNTAAVQRLRDDGKKDGKSRRARKNSK